MTRHEKIVIMLEEMLKDLDRSPIALEICRHHVFGYMEWLKQNVPELEHAEIEDR